MISLLKALQRPEYFYNPGQLWRRSWQKLSRSSEEGSSSQLLGESFQYQVSEDIGRALHSFGLYDLCVSEALWRLLRKGDMAIDVGANIGYFSLLMAKRTGPQGSVVAFEPNPQIVQILLANTKCCENISVHAVALSQHEQLGNLYGTTDYAANRGLASLQGNSEEVIAQVQLKALDSFSLKPRLIKMDVEGHELQVLRGAEQTLESVEHVVYEEHDWKNSGVKSFLEENGFKNYYLQKRFSELKLVAPNDSSVIDKTEPPNYLATRWAHDEITAHFAKGGWSFLRALRRGL